MAVTEEARGRARRGSWLAHRLAQVTAVTTVVLIFAGGLVTNTGAALAVPDWPTTFGYNMFLFPWAGMVGGVLYEHSHRLLGALVGLLTLGVAAALWPSGGRLRVLGLVAVAAVIAQGVLGGLRVVLLADTLAIVHGSLAQAFFALLVAITVMTSAGYRPASPRGRPASTPAPDPSLQALTLAAVAIVYVQIVFGALLTHAGWIELHLAGAVLVFVVVPIVTARLRRAELPSTRGVARCLLLLLIVQAALGIGSFLPRFSSIAIPGGQAAMLALPVAHRVVGSLILAAAVTLAVRVGVGGLRWARAADAAMSEATS